MKKLLGAVVCALLTGLSFGQTKPGDVVLDIPFAFVVGSQQMDGGRYIFSPAAEGIVRIALVGGGDRQVNVPVHSVQGSDNSPTRAVFRCYENSCFISQLWITGTSQGRQFYVSQAEKETMARRTNGDPPRNEVSVLQTPRR